MCDKWAGDGDRHVGIYASLDNWRTCILCVFLIGENIHWFQMCFNNFSVLFGFSDATFQRVLAL